MEHKELLARRITDIIIKLNIGETLNIDDLVEEYGTSKRTIQRDINERLAFLPLERSAGNIKLAKVALGKLSKQDINNFAQLCGVSELFPNLDSRFITSLLSNAYHSPYLVTGSEFEHDKEGINQTIKKLEVAINEQKLVTFQYKNKTYTNIAPYKLINHNQVWYVAVLEQNEKTKKIKTFHLGNIRVLFILNDSYIPCEKTSEQIAQSDDIYITEDKTEVVLKVSSQVAHYFKRRNILPNQKIDKELETGELIVSSNIAYDLQIIPLIKYWMPHLHVISPKGIHEQVLIDIKQYQIQK